MCDLRRPSGAVDRSGSGRPHLNRFSAPALMRISLLICWLMRARRCCSLLLCVRAKGSHPWNISRGEAPSKRSRYRGDLCQQGAKKKQHFVAFFVHLTLLITQTCIVIYCGCVTMVTGTDLLLESENPPKLGPVMSTKSSHQSSSPAAGSLFNTHTHTAGL